MAERSLSFGAVAAAYERFRPGYPDAVVDDLLAYARRPVRTALEIGAGTGKATRVVARRGIDVTATDPDPAMLAVLREHVPDTVVSLRAAFEELPLTPVYDLVFAAASLHWTDPADRWPRVAAMLQPQGIFACFGGQLHVAEAEVEHAVHAAGAPDLEDDQLPSPDGSPGDGTMQWPGTELARSDLFSDVRQSTVERRMTLDARDYVGHLSTVSAYLQLPERVRQRVLGRILRVLPDHVTVVADIDLHLARLRAADR